MDIAVIGASLPGLIMADSLSLYGHNVKLYGRSGQARSEMGFGPQYLWATNGVLKYLTRALCEEPKEIESRLRTVDVLWSKQNKIIGRTGDESVAGSFISYNKKTNSSGFPCKGMRSFQILANGFTWLREILNQRLDECCVLREEVNDVTQVIAEPRRIQIHTAVATHVHEAVVNTVGREIWCRLRGQASDPLETETFFHLSHTPPVEEKFDGLVMIYNGEANVPWFRCSNSETVKGVWVYECSRVLKPDELSYFQVKCVKAKFAANQRSGMAQQPRITHVGRWAEMDKEMMVSDVIENVDHYRFVVERDIS